MSGAPSGLASGTRPPNPTPWPKQFAIPEPHAQLPHRHRHRLRRRGRNHDGARRAERESPWADDGRRQRRREAGDPKRPPHRGDLRLRRAVFAGADKPLTRPHEHAHWFHGKDGLGNRKYPAPKRKAEREGAVEAIVRLSQAEPGLTLITLGPLTNVALALEREPELAERIGRCVVMGGRRAARAM